MPDNNGKFVLLEAPAALPGKCTGCGRANDARGFIDTGYDADFWGVIYYCYECVLDMASKFGFIGPDTAEKLMNKIAELQVETASQRAAILGLEETVDGLLRVRDSGASDITVPVQPESITKPEVEETVAEEESANLGDCVSEEPDFAVTTGDSEINDPLVEQKSSGVSSDNGLADWAELSI